MEQKINIQNFDIIVIGGGHAGIEAAWISAQMNLSICLISSKDAGLASAPCNPAIGGVGKGQVVREIDALGGLMGRLADLSGIQYRTLNESKGYAVQSTRVQIDKIAYSKNAENILSTVSNLTIIRSKVELVSRSSSGFNIITSEKINLSAKKVIITTGTFLNGKLHTGENQVLGGRVNCENSLGINDLLPEIKMNPMRFKTGTPPRLLNSSIDYSKLKEQKSDELTRNFSFSSDRLKRNISQKSCYLAETNQNTMDVIRENRERSPIFNGQIKGVGPRYCPSIEDKAFRYVDKSIHHVFIEPEGLEINTIYPNGLSTSLPIDVQKTFINSIEGLEKAEILVNGYAVEYDVIDTSLLSQTLEHKDINGLYFAGQVCGTSGYEEAAGQGIIAGINAGMSIRKLDSVILSREDSYIGVMIEDLVINRRDEPYRLFTARSENRLFIREDNTIQRIKPYRDALKLNQDIDHYQANFMLELGIALEIIRNTIYYNNSSTQNYFLAMNYGALEVNTTLTELVRRGHLDPVKTLETELKNAGIEVSYDVIYTLAISIKYEGYINRSIIESEKLNKLAKKTLDVDKLLSSSQISFECKSRIKAIRPATFGQLQKMEGIRPATLAFVAGNIL